MVLELNGVLPFSLRRPGEPDDGPLQDPRPMPVPAAYNDIYPDAALRDHVGEAAYERTFTVSAPMLAGRLVLRFGGVAHRARVYVNGALAAEHLGGCPSRRRSVVWSAWGKTPCGSSRTTP